jgi:hypothetical protein
LQVIDNYIVNFEAAPQSCRDPSSGIRSGRRRWHHSESGSGGGQSGADLRPPQAAVVKSNGGERCGNVGRFRQARLREASASKPLQKTSPEDRVMAVRIEKSGLPGHFCSPAKSRLCNPCLRNELSPFSQEGHGLLAWAERTRTCRCHFHDVYCSSWAKGLRSHNVR